MTITKRYTSEVPKDEHEAPFLVVYIPGNIVSEVPQNDSGRLTKLLR